MKLYRFEQPDNPQSYAEVLAVDVYAAQAEIEKLNLRYTPVLKDSKQPENIKAMIVVDYFNLF